MKSRCKGAGIILWALALFIAPLPALPLKAQEQGKVTLQFQGMDIVEVLKLLAEQAGYNIVAGKNVSGRVTLFVREVDPWEAFEVILAANELAYERRGNILTILTQRDYELLHGQPYQDRRIVKSLTPRYAKVVDLSRALTQVKSNIGRVIPDEASNTVILMDTPPLVEQMAKLIEELDQPIQTRIFPLNYGAVKTMVPVLQEAVTKGVGKISVDERTNQVAITDSPAKLDELSRMLKAFDERSTEVLIEAKIIQVTLNDKFQLGIDWQAVGRQSLNIKGLTALDLTSGGSLRLASSDSISHGKAGDWKVVIEALRTYGDTKILSEPTLTAVNNQEAKILVGTKEPYVTKSTSQTGTGTAVTAESVHFIDVGVKLFVTPTITRDGFILMKVRPEVSSKTGTLTTSEKNEIPIVETSEAESVVLVEDGGSVILGGLIKNEKAIDQQRIPLLADIPVLGGLFRNTKETIKRTELVVFLTPQIVTGSREESGTTALEVEPAKSAPKSDPEPFRQYQENIQNLIQKVARVQATLVRAKGKVVVELTLTPEGRLQQVPRILEMDSEALRVQAYEAVLVASHSFPPWAPGTGKEPRTFQVSFVYE